LLLSSTQELTQNLKALATSSLLPANAAAPISDVVVPANALRNEQIKRQVRQKGCSVSQHHIRPRANRLFQ
jgi:hypothetical protein